LDLIILSRKSTNACYVYRSSTVCTPALVNNSVKPSNTSVLKKTVLKKSAKIFSDCY